MTATDDDDAECGRNVRSVHGLRENFALAHRGGLVFVTVNDEKWRIILADVGHRTGEGTDRSEPLVDDFPVNQIGDHPGVGKISVLPRHQPLHFADVF